MNELIVNADGTVTTVGDAGSVSGIIADAVKASTIPEERDLEGVITKAEVVPDADTLMVEVSAEDLKTHAWRLPKVRLERLEQLRGVRNAKLDLIDTEIDKATKNQPGFSRTVANSEVEKQTLRDLPPAIVTHLDGLTNTDDMDVYVPTELE
uniref:Uncharacterized protein n=1 Tax=uncultured marine virus TaxID=186617 RepID=A0A0F7L987_9VIRU|nr:hypothetical protein [uncultured marine virus]